MFRRTDDLRIRDVRPLIPPAILLEEIPITEQASNLVFETRMTLMNIIGGFDPRLALIVGPCSIHDPKAALEYGERLNGGQEKGLVEFLRDSLLSGGATDEELAFLKSLRFKDRRPTALFYYRELQNLRDPLHFRA